MIRARSRSSASSGSFEEFFKRSKMLFEIFDPKAAPKPIGIDLGTTNSLVACVRNEKPDVIGNCDLEYLLPSVVSYAEKEPIVGTRAMKMASEHPRETIVS